MTERNKLALNLSNYKMLSPPFALMIILERDSIVLLTLSSITNGSHNYWTQTGIACERQVGYRLRYWVWHTVRYEVCFTFLLLKVCYVTRIWTQLETFSFLQVEKTKRLCQHMYNNLRTPAQNFLVVLPLQEASRSRFAPKDPSEGSMLSWPSRELGPVMRKPKRLGGLIIPNAFGVRDCDYQLNYAIFLSAKAHIIGPHNLLFSSMITIVHCA